jgi:hypothetical protein
MYTPRCHPLLSTWATYIAPDLGWKRPRARTPGLRVLKKRTPFEYVTLFTQGEKGDSAIIWPPWPLLPTRRSHHRFLLTQRHFAVLSYTSRDNYFTIYFFLGVDIRLEIGHGAQSISPPCRPFCGTFPTVLSRPRIKLTQRYFAVLSCTSG